MSDAQGAKRGSFGAIKNPQDFWGALALIAIGLIALWSVRNLPWLQGFRFTSGTSPRLFTYLMLLCAAGIAIRAFIKSGPGLEKYPWRGPLMIIAAVFVFAFCIRPYGMVFTGIVSVMIASFAMRDSTWLEALIFSVLITIFCTLLFPYALNQPVPVWPSEGPFYLFNEAFRLLSGK